MDEKPVPVVIKKKKGHDAHHGGAWKVAYADFVTAMMALFIVLWVLGQDEEIKSAVAGYFKDPIGFSDKNLNLLDGKSNEFLNLELEEMRRRELEKAELERMGQQIIDELSDNPEFSSLMDQIKIEIVEEGLRIELMDASDDIFFQVGTSALSHKAKLILQKISISLAKLPNKIVVEGHTDSRPYEGNGGGYTNFELSADRANAARKEITTIPSVEQQLVEIRGYADRKLRDPKDPYSLVNRRISIIVKYSAKK